jgi:hypothetical protein
VQLEKLAKPIINYVNVLEPTFSILIPLYASALLIHSSVQLNSVSYAQVSLLMVLEQSMMLLMDATATKTIPTLLHLIDVNANLQQN